jgi:hypothetical protein
VDESLVVDDPSTAVDESVEPLTVIDDNDNLVKPCATCRGTGAVPAIMIENKVDKWKDCPDCVRCPNKCDNGKLVKSNVKCPVCYNGRVTKASLLVAEKEKEKPIDE